MDGVRRGSPDPLGDEQLVALIQVSLSVAHKTGAIATKDLEQVVVDTTVQPKAIAHPTDARLMHRAIVKLVDLATRAFSAKRNFAYAYNYLIYVRFGIMVDVEASRAVRQAEVGAARTMLE